MRSPSSACSSAFTVARGAAGEGEGDAAFDGANYLVVWQDSRDGNDDVYAARVSAEGVLLDALPIIVSAAPNAQRRPRVAFDGTNYLVVWEDWRSDTSSDIYEARVSPAGTLLDPEGRVLSAGTGDQLLPAVAFGVDIYLVTWSDTRSGSGSRLRGTRVDTAGNPLDVASREIAGTAPDDHAAGLAFAMPSTEPAQQLAMLGKPTQACTCLIQVLEIVVVIANLSQEST